MILQQEKMAAMGEMLGLIAHQWRQPLSTISAVLSTIKVKMMLADGALVEEDLLKSLATIDNSVDFLSTTIMDFKNFFKHDKDMQAVFLNELVERTVDLIGESLRKEAVIVDFSACHYEKKIKVFSNELIQVILNIINNAVDASLELKVKDPKIVITSDENEKEQKIYIQDYAGGIPAHVIDHIFDSDFTTKADDKGTGLGLYMSKIIVEEHCGGELSVENSTDGARFCISIPFEAAVQETL